MTKDNAWVLNMGHCPTTLCDTQYIDVLYKSGAVFTGVVASHWKADVYWNTEDEHCEYTIVAWRAVK